MRKLPRRLPARLGPRRQQSPALPIGKRSDCDIPAEENGLKFKVAHSSWDFPMKVGSSAVPDMGSSLRNRGAQAVLAGQEDGAPDSSPFISAPLRGLNAWAQHCDKGR